MNKLHLYFVFFFCGLLTVTATFHDVKKPLTKNSHCKGFFRWFRKCTSAKENQQTLSTSPKTLISTDSINPVTSFNTLSPSSDINCGPCRKYNSIVKQCLFDIDYDVPQCGLCRIYDVTKEKCIFTIDYKQPTTLAPSTESTSIVPSTTAVPSTSSSTPDSTTLPYSERIPESTSDQSTDITFSTSTVDDETGDTSYDTFGTTTAESSTKLDQSTFTPQSTDTTTFRFVCDEGDKKPNYLDCKSYIECINNEFVEKECDFLQKFDSITLQCKYKGAECAHSPDD